MFTKRSNNLQYSEILNMINIYAYTDFSGSKLEPEDNTLSNRTLVLLSSAITYTIIAHIISNST